VKQEIASSNNALPCLTVFFQVLSLWFIQPIVKKGQKTLLTCSNAIALLDTLLSILLAR
jgi:hypothetical protein